MFGGPDWIAYGGIWPLGHSFPIPAIEDPNKFATAKTLLDIRHKIHNKKINKKIKNEVESVVGVVNCFNLAIPNARYSANKISRQFTGFWNSPSVKTVTEVKKKKNQHVWFSENTWKMAHHFAQKHFLSHVETLGGNFPPSVMRSPKRCTQGK